MLQIREANLSSLSVGQMFYRTENSLLVWRVIGINMFGHVLVKRLKAWQFEYIRRPDKCIVYKVIAANEKHSKAS